MIREMGIVLDKIEDGKIRGHYLKTKVSMELDKENRVVVNEEKLKTYFELNTQDGIYEMLYGGSDLTAIEVGNQLKKIGFEKVILRFNERLIYI